MIAPGNCLDLSEAACLEALKTAHAGLSKTYSELGISLPTNQGSHKNDRDLVKRHLDCAVVNFLHGVRQKEGKPAYDTVRSPFFEGEPVYPGSGIAKLTHIQWCIREPARSILGYFRPRPEVE